MCKHNNGKYIEHIDAITSFGVKDGVVDPEGYHDEGDFTRMSFECSDCGKRFDYSALSRRPQWIKRFWDQLK